MFEAVCLGRTLSKPEFERQETELRQRLLDVQFQLKQQNKAVLILLAGVDGARKSDVIDQLNKWMDTRSIQVHAFWNNSNEETERPFYWRFWRNMPARKTIGIFFSGWYWQLIHDHVNGKIKNGEFDRACHQVLETESMLSDDGMIIIKLWLHLDRQEQKKRLKALRKEFKDTHIPLSGSKMYKKYDAYINAAQRAIQLTDNVTCKWHLIEATDANYRDITAGQLVLEAMEKAVKEQREEERRRIIHDTALTVTSARTVLDELNLTVTSDKHESKHRLEKYQRKLYDLAWQCFAEKRSVVLMFEGWDAAGKGGSIRRLTAAMDARLYRVISVAAPTDEELARHYLWRFWRHIPRAGYFTLYDRSWYGRVLVERVERLTSEHEWGRAYQEINNFEEQLIRHGIVLMKFWLHIDQDEQLARFQARETTPWKNYKITEEDWRNRDKWDDYKRAVHDMVIRTSTDRAPWQLIPANDKHYARAEIIQRVCDKIESELA
ncbi:MAG: polyphosphate:AMP phosphotransferase [Gammaproteobacteria bacterium]